MSSELLLRRKWTLKAHGRQVVFVKRPNEQASHVLMKALLWGLYLPEYPELAVEIPVGDRYKPDVVARGPDQRPLFWGEAGQVNTQKIRSLARRYRDTHFAIAKWASRLETHRTVVEKVLAGLPRRAPFDLIVFGADSAERFVDDDGCIRISHADLEWIRLHGDYRPSRVR